MKHWIMVIIAIGLFALHTRLSASKYWFLGGFLPLAGIGAAIYQLFVMKAALSPETILAYLVFFAASVLLWIVGRHEYRQKEWRKMKARDIQE